MAKLRFASKHLFLTYPKCDVPLKVIHELLVVLLRTKHNGIKNYIIAHEDHKDGTPHRHVWLETHSALDRVDANFFDIEGHHGNYLSMKFHDNCAKYVIKGGEYLTSFTENKLNEMIMMAETKQSDKIDKRVIGKRLLNGDKLLDIVQEYPALLWDLSKLRDNVLLYRQLSSTAIPLEKLENEWIWGPTGSGKSKYVSETFPDAHRKPREVFWDSYEFEDVVVLEDVDETWEDVLWELKLWADHYPYLGRIKHKPSLKMRPKKIIITSNYTIHEVMERIFKRKGIAFDGMLIKALERRFKEIKLENREPLKELEIFPDNYFCNENEQNELSEISYMKFIDL